MLHALIGVRSERDLETHPKLGSFWEGFALEEICRQMQVSQEECYFWKTQSGAELDLLIVRDGKRLGIEIKYTDHPKITSSMRIALKDLKLDHLYVIIPGNAMFQLSENITVLGLSKNVLNTQHLLK
jgi:predicted AAA+ superfamily ATPase